MSLYTTRNSSSNNTTTNDDDGKILAAYLVQGITLQIPQPDRKGRVDMSKASLQFNPGPPPPLFEFGPSQFDPSITGERKSGKGGRAESRVVWRGMRTFRQRAVLLACARNVGQSWDVGHETKHINFSVAFPAIVNTFEKIDESNSASSSEPLNLPV